MQRSIIASQSRRELAKAFEATFGRWARQSFALHAGCVLVLMLVPTLRWWSTISDTSASSGDERPYFAAFELVAVGESPFTDRAYLYPAAFAYAGSWSVEHLGRPWTDGLLRAANLLGLAVVVWCSMAWLPWSAGMRLLAGGAFVLLAPQVDYSVESNNLSLAVAGMVVAGLLLAERQAVAAGLLLGGSVALKPIAPVAIGCLAIKGRRRDARRSLVAAGVAMAVVAVLVVFFPHFDELVARTRSQFIEGTVSLHRFPKLFGLEIDALWISVAVALAAAAVVLRGSLGRARFLCFATTAAIAATPIVRSHTLVVLLPLEVLALTVAWRRWRAGRTGGATVPSWLESALVLLAVAGLQLSAGAGTIHGQGVLLELAGGGLPAVAPFALVGYLLRTTERF
ncbi:MAG: glycosyltransferase 87 family protein [Acidobacteria bacterium]|nr:glycosyltransferase 87 family protein [Acidobacteriota bacterium]